MEKLYMSHAVTRTLYGRTGANAISRFMSEIPETLITMDKPYNRKKDLRQMQTSPLFTGAMMHQKKESTQSLDIKQVKAGNKIKHPKFGIGTVVSVNGDMLTIAFPNSGIKKISSTFIQLEIIG